jgi:histidinol-phosphate aminotransferase
MQPYSSARSEFSGHAEIFLDANENAYGSAVAEALNRYPDPMATGVQNVLATQLAVQPDQIIVGNGSDEIITLLVLTFCDPANDAIVITPPTFGMYEVAAGMNAVPVRRVPLQKDFTVPVDAVIAASQGAKLTFLCSPNNPTGNLVPREEILQLANSISGLLVIDEAYIDYAPGSSVVDAIVTQPNIFVIRTLSKAYGMAGARVGLGIGSHAVVEYLMRVKPPYNVNQLSQQHAEAALQNQDFLRSVVSKTITERDRLEQSLVNLSAVVHVYPSAANFLLVQFEDAQAVFSHVLAAGVVVRNRSSVPGCHGCLRITVGTPEENDRLIEVLLERES